MCSKILSKIIQVSNYARFENKSDFNSKIVKNELKYIERINYFYYTLHCNRDVFWRFLFINIRDL